MAESWVERRIREAQQHGDFDDLPGAGKPLAFLDEPPQQDWWLRGLLRRERIDISALLPPPLALRREAQDLPARVLREPSERAARDLAEDYNARVRECLSRPQPGPAVVVRTVDVEALVAAWRDTHARPAAPPPGTAPAAAVAAGGSPAHAPPRRRGRWAATLRRLRSGPARR